MACEQETHCVVNSYHVVTSLKADINSLFNPGV